MKIKIWRCDDGRRSFAVITKPWAAKLSGKLAFPRRKTLNDGRRQISGFYLPGEVFGLSFDDEHTVSAEAINECNVLVIKRSAVDALAGRDAAIARELFTLIGRELRRAQDRVLLLIKNAQERVAGISPTTLA